MPIDSTKVCFLGNYFCHIAEIVYLCTMKRILFVCHGNICRSPMAEYILKKLVRQSGLENQFVIASAALSNEEAGNPVYPLARQELAMHGIGCSGHSARQIKTDDYNQYDLIIGMEDSHVQQMRRRFGGDPDGKLHLLIKGHDIADPWYTRNFRTAWNDIYKGCVSLLNELTTNNGRDN